MEESAFLTATTKKNLEALLKNYEKKLRDVDIESKQIIEQAKVEGTAELTRIKEEKRKWEEEKKAIVQTYTFEDGEIKLDIGGKCFTTTLTSLTRFPDTMIGAMFSGRHDLKKNASGAYFLDRDGKHFRQILNFLRAPENYQIYLQAPWKALP
jgi:hypothetical protein